MKLVRAIVLVVVILSLAACESPADRAGKLIPQLADPDPAVETQAYDNLVPVGEPALAPMTSALRGDFPTVVRCGVAWALGQTRMPAAIGPLIATQGDSDPEVSQWAQGALVFIGAPAVDPLIAALQAGDTQVRIASACTLGEIGDRRAVQPLINALQDNDVSLRHMSAIALGNLRDAQAAAPLVALLKDADSGVRSAAILALQYVGPPAVDPLLSALYDDAPYVILDDGSKMEVRREAALTLGLIGDGRAIGPLIGSLGDDDADFAQDAARGLSLIGEPAVGPLISGLYDSNPQVVRKSAWALGRIKDPSAVEPLISVIENQDNPQGQAAYKALAAMGKAAEPRLTEFLADALTANNLKIIAACYDFYILKGDPATEGPLIAAFNLYADAYGNYDDDGKVTIGERYLNCGDDALHRAAIGWGEQHSFNVVVTPCAQVASKWGDYVYDDYCGQGRIMWGNSGAVPDQLYVLYREMPDVY